MKKTILTIAVIFILSGCASHQYRPDIDPTFERVVQAPGYSRDQLFNLSKIWIAENFKSSKAVLEYENKEDGTIIGNGVIPYPCSGIECIVKPDWRVPFTMRIDVKDNKFRLVFSNLRIAWPASYNKTTGVQSAYEGPMKSRGDFEAVRPILLRFGDSILASLHQNKTKTDW